MRLTAQADPSECQTKLDPCPPHTITMRRKAFIMFAEWYSGASPRVRMQNSKVVGARVVKQSHFVSFARH